ncbi:MAG: hypothetical protein A2W90_14845 [Bacteroidetes bacterium GWF2_42_66]|nr:MAG: hypothetical protein A2W92_11010 [Bacteroidetes bacterium GWA2_42_15]OFX98969.1 MAG: hypothetical protein A2W89_06430 [Bacteroidetes bacterium GWE2_42_39]OFY46038.1 MAG: hypothetical protein A2W90_14845 [Bacteroidetes bacterium GWF2_42_66]HBL77203.1 hypothetical protein [Prolixibacteraceae bacterium]HCR90050.1 hypothetical protein [Prolixibacteraceae bacterium]
MKYIQIIFAVLLLIADLSAKGLYTSSPDTLVPPSVVSKADLFYDSLEVRAHRHRLTGWLYDAMITNPGERYDTEIVSYEYYRQFEGKTIASVKIQPLDVFGPTFDDTTRVAKSGFERFANSIHTKSNINAIRRNLWIREGAEFDANLLMDNERLLRELPYLKDARILVTSRPENPQLVDILILTKDVFAFGITGEIDEIDSGKLGIYNQNVLGIGHEISAKFVGHLDREPYMGVETFYSVKNFRGDFVDFRCGYFNTYQRHGYLVNFNKEFLRPQSAWAGGFNFSKYFRTDRMSLTDPVKIDFPLNLWSYDVWYGRNLQLGINKQDSRFQMTVSGRVRQFHFIERPSADSENNQYFANSTFYLGSLSFSQRHYVRDRLVYSYGITEDIPKGYLHEMVVGYDDNEFMKRWYSHWYFSSGNIVRYKPFYLFASAGIGGYFNKDHYEQGMIECNLDFISRLFNTGPNKARQFLKVNYILGIRRFDIENVLLRYRTGIRGFTSRQAIGQQRLTVNLETVFFQEKEFLKFNTAFFSFLDLGIIGSNRKVIFTQDYYAGIGFGVRLRNESLVFKTIQIRLAYYPNHPADMGGFGFILEEQLRSRFYSFQPKAPEPLVFD